MTAIAVPTPTLEVPGPVEPDQPMPTPGGPETPDSPPTPEPQIPPEPVKT